MARKRLSRPLTGAACFAIFRDESIGDDALIRAIRAVHLYHFQSASHGRPFIENSQTDCCRHIEKRWSLYGRLIMRIEYLSDKL